MSREMGRRAHGGRRCSGGQKRAETQEKGKERNPARSRGDYSLKGRSRRQKKDISQDSCARDVDGNGARRMSAQPSARTNRSILLNTYQQPADVCKPWVRMLTVVAETLPPLTGRRLWPRDWVHRLAQASHLGQSRIQASWWPGTGSTSWLSPPESAVHSGFSAPKGCK